MNIAIIRPLIQLGVALAGIAISVSLSAYLSYCTSYVSTMKRLHLGDGTRPPKGLWREAQRDFFQLIKSKIERQRK